MLLSRLLTIILGFIVSLPSTLALAASDGEALYKEQCIDCHGDRGQGTDVYSSPLAGDLPVVRLTEVIEQTMPEGEPELCVTGDARAVAAYIHSAFYSPLAQARLRPARVDLSRLTSRQYKQTVLDLAQSFTWHGKQDQQRGLKAEFFRGKRPAKEKQAFDEVVPGVDFQLIASGLFGKEYLFPEKAKGDNPIAKANEQSVFLRWDGGLLARDTGEYELVVHTNAGFQLWLNGDQPLINKQVQSGEEQGGRATVYLVGGRAYRLRLQVTRVFEEDVTVSLAWRPPGGIEEPIPARVLTPHVQPNLLVVEARLPPDDHSAGFARGADVSAQWDEATTDAALETADKLIAWLPRQLKLPEDPAAARSKVQAFCLDFGDRAFRRPLSDDVRRRYVDRHFAEDHSWQVAAKLSLVSTLKSPWFLYPQIATAEAGRDWRNASRLALALWDSIPDEPLTRLARQKKLSEKQQVRRQAEWMLKDPRATAKLREFFALWLDMESVDDLSRDQQVFQGFDKRVAADLKASLELFVDDLLASQTCDFRQLFLSDETYLNDRLAAFLGAEAPEGGEDFQRVRFESDRRAGVVTHPYVVATHAYFRESSPIHRGVFLARHMLGRALPPPPIAVAPTPPGHQPNLTTRERVALQTSPAACQHCHVLINGLGFSLEAFDAVGRYRQQDAGHPVDASGGYVSTEGQHVDFRGAKELARHLATSPDVQRAFVVQLFEHVAKQPILAYGQETPELLVEAFEQSDFNVRELLVEIAVTVATHQET